MAGPKLPRPPRRPLLTAAEIAVILNVSVRTVRRLIKDKKLAIVHVGRAVRVRPEALEALIGSELTSDDRLRQ